MKSLIRPVALFAALALISGCYEVPVTGRHAVNLVDSKEVVKMSITAFEDMKHTYKISKDKNRIDQLDRVGERLKNAIPWWQMENADWEFVVFDVPNEINAFAMAGGKVGVFTGLFKIIDNDDQLASVLAHEFAHVTANHVAERLSRQLTQDTISTVGGVALGIGTGGLTTLAIMSAYGLANSESSDLAFDRQKELEADNIGLIYMSQAGYDPREAVTVLQKLEDLDAGSPSMPAFASTHPSNPQRIEQLQKLMPKAMAAYEKAKAELGTGK